MRTAWVRFAEARSRGAFGALVAAVGAWMLATAFGQWLLLGMVVVLSGQPVFWHLTGTASSLAALGDGLAAWAVVVGVYTRAWPRPLAQIVSLLVDIAASRA